MVLTFLKVTAQPKVMENCKNSLEKVMESHEIWRAQKGANPPWVRSPLLLVTLASIFVFSRNAPPQQLRQKWCTGTTPSPLAGFVLGSPNFNSSATLVNSQLVCLVSFQDNQSSAKTSEQINS